MQATFTSKGQITLPVAVRRALDLKPGQKLAIRVQDDSVVINCPSDVESVRTRLQDEAKKAAPGHLGACSRGW